jgi:hypothetical protein
MFTMIRKILSSRPDPEEGLSVQGLSIEEIQLIGAFLWATRLGSGVSPYRDAAFSLMTKIEEQYGDPFMEHAAIDVDLVVHIIDQNGNVERSVGHHFVEFDV